MSRILTREGFHVDAVSTASEALEQLRTHLYHVLVLDIRLESNSPENIDGMNLLSLAEQQDLTGAMEVIMLSAFGTREQMRSAFSRYKVADFLSKDDFDHATFGGAVRQFFDGRLHIALDLKIHWQQTNTTEQLVANLEVDGKRVKRDAALQALLTVELEDLLCKLFYTASSVIIRPLTPGHKSSVVLLATPFYESGAGLPVIVKVGDFCSINTEHYNYTTHVQPFVGGGRTTSVLALRRTPHLGGIVYSTLGSTPDAIESFRSFYGRYDIAEIVGALDNLINNTCGGWYANPGRLGPLDLTDEYQRLLEFTGENLENALRHSLKSVQGNHKLKFNSLTSERLFTNPIPSISGRHYLISTYTCLTHGDLTADNLFVDSAGHTWLIDFDSTGPGHILRDIASLDAVVRIQLLAEGEATLDERLKMEEALCGINTFSRVHELSDALQSENQAVNKAYAIALHLRTIAQKLVAQNPSDDINEYYIALMYYSLNAIRFYALPAVQRQHALLSASLLVDRLNAS